MATYGALERQDETMQHTDVEGHPCPGTRLSVKDATHYACGICGAVWAESDPQPYAHATYYREAPLEVWAEWDERALGVQLARDGTSERDALDILEAQHGWDGADTGYRAYLDERRALVARGTGPADRAEGTYMGADY